MSRPPDDPHAQPPIGPVGTPSVGRPAPPSKPPQPPRTDPTKTLAIAVGGVLAVLVVILGAVLLLGRSPDRSPSPSPFTGVLSPSPAVTTSPSTTGTPSPSPTPTATPTPTPTQPPTPSPTPLPTPSPSPSPSPTASPTVPPTASPSPTLPPTATPTLQPTPTLPPSATPSIPTDGNVSGEIDPATEQFLTRIQLAEEDLVVEQLQREGELQAGNDLVDYASFRAHNGRGVVWQGWTGPTAGAIERMTDIRMAFPTPEDAIGFVAAFGDEVARLEGLTEFDAVTIGEESRAFDAVRSAPPGNARSLFLHLWRRGDLVGVVTVVLPTDDHASARSLATDLAVRAGEKVDRAVGIEP